MRTKIVSLSLVLIIWVSLFSPTTSASAIIVGDTECRPAVLFLRGSDEPNLNHQEYKKEISDENGDPIPSGPTLFQTNGNEGPTLQRLLRNFANQSTTPTSTDHVRFIGVEYPALAVPGFPVNNGAFGDAGRSLSIWEHIMKYDESYRIGAEKVVSLIREDESRGCNTNYMLVGYSQGVISLRLAIGLLGNDFDKVVSTYVIGDPFQTAFAAWSDEHKSPASTSYFTYGVGHTAASTIKLSVSALGFGPFVQSYIDSMSKADQLVYQRDEFRGRYSRAICHLNDPVCGVEPSFSMAEHTNYFLTDDDLAYEISAFNDQVEFLANSAPKVSNYRGLSSIPGKDGKVTYYVSGAKMTEGSADTCRWDKDSDGNYEVKENGEDLEGCGLMTFAHEENTIAKMTVEITDHVGNIYIRSIETKTFEDKTLEEIYALDQDSWYQIHPYGKSGYCLTFIQDSYKDIDNSDRVFFENQECGPTTVDPNDPVALTEASKQVFRMKTVTDPETGESRDRLVLGYDDDFVVWQNHDFDYYMATPIEVANTDEMTSSDFIPSFITIDENSAYYSFITPTEHALWHDSHKADTDHGVGMSGYGDIMRHSPYVLWSVTPVQGEFGSLSNEKDMTPPNEVENLTLNGINETSAFIHWDTSVDNRRGEVTYKIYEVVNGEKVFIEEISNNEFEVILESNRPYKNTTIVVEAVDNKGNSTTGTSISFTTPSNFTPEPPTLNCVCDDYTSARINFISAFIPEVDHIQVYRDGNLIGTTQEALYIDEGLTRGESYDYSYKVVTPSGLVSEMSDFLRVQMADTEIPTAPTNLTFKEPFEEFVEITWDSGIDASDDYLTYHLYRDGIKLNDYFFTSQNGAWDYQTERGRTYVYTVIAEDAFGNFSPVSEPLTITVPVYVDEIPPTKPVLNLTIAYPTEVTFAIESSDQGGWIEEYDIYRDGTLLATVNDNIFIDGTVSPNSIYEYTVVARDNSGNKSVMSQPLEVNTLNSVAPTPPTNLEIGYQSGSEVSINWLPGTDDLDNFLKYCIYRDGVELTEGFYAYDFGGYDYLAEPGMTYVYTVVTEDSSGNRSEPSEPITVTIQENQGGGGEDITPPTKPEVTFMDAWDEVIGFSFHAEDDQGVSSFDIYRDGVFIANTYDWFYYDQGLTPETSYEYTVVARDYSDNTSETSEPLVASTTEAGGGSGPGDPGSEEPEVPTPSVPGVESFNLDYLAHNVAQISWTINNTTGLSYRYDIYRNGVLVAENRSWNPYGGGINSSPEAYIDEGLEPDTTYTYEVVVKSWSGSSSPISSPFVVHTPSAPDGDTDENAPSSVKLVYIYKSEHGISLGWTPAVDDTEVAAYEIYRDGILIHTLDTSAADYYGSFYEDVEGASSQIGTTHSYQIVVVDSSGNRNDTSPAFDYTVGT